MVEKIEFDPVVPTPEPQLTFEPPAPPPPTVIGKPVAVTGTPVGALSGDPV
jgi:hypothetical protein